MTRGIKYFDFDHRLDFKASIVDCDLTSSSLQYRLVYSIISNIIIFKVMKKKTKFMKELLSKEKKQIH